MAKAWQERWSLKVELPDAKVVALQLMEGEEGNPEFLWEPIFKSLGKASVLGQIRDFPTISQFKDIIGKEPTVIILDELESWYEATADRVRKTRNLNFLQVLSEISSDSDCKLIVLTSLYGRNEEILGRLGRDQVFIQDLGASEEGGFTAYVPSLPDCISEGNTEEKALANIKLNWHRKEATRAR